MSTKAQEAHRLNGESSKVSDAIAVEFGADSVAIQEQVLGEHRAKSFTDHVCDH